MLVLLSFPNQAPGASEELVWDEASDRLYIKWQRSTLLLGDNSEVEEGLDPISFVDAQKHLIGASQWGWMAENTIKAGLMPGNSAVQLKGYKSDEECPWVQAKEFKVFVEGNSQSPFVFKETEFKEVLGFASTIALQELGYNLDLVA